MSNLLDSMMVKSPEIYTQSREFRIFMEPFITVMISDPGTIHVAFTPELRHLYAFTLNTFLLSKGIPVEDHYIVYRMNNIDDVHRLDPTMDTLMIPSIDSLNMYKALYLNKIKK